MSRTRNLTIDARMYRMSGIGRYLQTLLPDLIPLLDADRIVLLGKPGDLEGETWMRDPRILLRGFPARIFSVAEQLAAARNLYRDTDLLWVPHYNIPLLYRGKLVVTVHDVCQLAHPETLANDLQRWYARTLLSAVASRARAILCVSEFSAGEVQKYLRVPSERLNVIYPPISNPWKQLDPEQPPRSGGRYLLAVGNVKKHKNMKRLIEAFGLVRDQIPHDLIIVGQQAGFINPEADLSSTTSLLEGRVRFTGHVSEADLRRHYRNADALVFPSIYEGFGSPVVEAMAQGCPVACSRAASLPEVAGDAALYFDPFSAEDIRRALLQIAGNEELRKHLGQRGLRRAEKFRGTACARDTARVINRVAADRPANEA